MPFTDRFQLLDLKRDEGARTFEAREIATGRPVLVHLFDRTSPLNRALLAKFETLPEEEKSRVIDRGEHEGGVYIVTDRLAEYPGLREWLKAKNEERRKTLDVAGAWEIKRAVPKPDDDRLKALFPTAPRPVLEPSAVEEPAAPVLTDTREQTLLMPAPKEPGPVAAPPAVPSPPPIAAPEAGEFTPPVMRPAPSSPAPPPIPAPQTNEPGEFTRQFAPPVMRPAPASPPSLPPSPAPPANEPGEFTRQFAPPVMRPAPSTPPPASPAAAANEPGEFTRQFVPPTVMRPTPVPSPPAQQQQQPGEFTAMFASQKAAPPPNPAAQPISQPVSQPQSQPGEFTRLFQAPQRPVPAPRVPPPAVPPPQNPAQPVSQQVSQPPLQPGEFTQMLQAQRPAAPPPANKDSNDFGRFFQSPLAPLPDGPQTHMAPLTPPPTPPQPKGAGEFTQIFGRGALPSPPPPPMSAAPPPSSSDNNATQVFAAPRAASTVPLPVSGGTPLAPGEYTRMFAKPAGLTFGQAPTGPQAPRAPESFAKTRNKSRLPLLLAIGAAVLLIAAIVVYFMLRPHTN